MVSFRLRFRATRTPSTPGDTCECVCPCVYEGAKAGGARGALQMWGMQ